MHPVYWFLHYTGISNEAGPWYGFWSGFGSDIGELAILGGLVTVVRHWNCCVPGCWRLGHPDPEHGHPACRHHHSRRDHPALH